MELLIGLLSGLIGAVVGGGFSLLGVWCTQHSERKLRKEADERQMRMFMLQKNREAKEKLYIPLAQILEKIDTNIAIDPNTERMYLSQAKTEKHYKKLVDFQEKNCGELSIYCPHSLARELDKLICELYKIVSQRQEVTFEDLKNVNTSSALQVQLHAKNITSQIKADLNIVDISNNEQHKSKGE